MFRSGDRQRTRPTAGALAGSGWQYKAGSALPGTAIALIIHHGQNISEPSPHFVSWRDYKIVLVRDSGSDLRIFEVAETLPL